MLRAVNRIQIQWMAVGVVVILVTLGCNSLEANVVPTPTAIPPTQPPSPRPTPTLGNIPWPDRDCHHFKTWKEAQDFFVANGGPERDPHYLDADRDGIACERLRWGR